MSDQIIIANEVHTPSAPKIGLLPTPYWDRYVGLGMLPFVINEIRVNLHTSLARADMRKPHLLLPLPRQLPMIWLDGDISIGDLARALGLGTHDYALPQRWVQRNYCDRGLPMPMGVWDYTHNRVMGQFLGFDQMLCQIADMLLMGLWEGSIPGLPNHQQYDNPRDRDGFAPRVITTGDICATRVNYHGGDYQVLYFVCLSNLGGRQISATPYTKHYGEHSPVWEGAGIEPYEVYTLEFVNGVWYLPKLRGNL